MRNLQNCLARAPIFSLTFGRITYPPVSVKADLRASMHATNRLRLAGPKIYSRLRCNLICVLEISMLATIGRFLSARLRRFCSLMSRLRSGGGHGRGL